MTMHDVPAPEAADLWDEIPEGCEVWRCGYCQLVYLRGPGREPQLKYCPEAAYTRFPLPIGASGAWVAPVAGTYSMVDGRWTLIAPKAYPTREEVAAAIWEAERHELTWKTAQETARRRGVPPSSADVARTWRIADAMLILFAPGTRTRP